MRSAEFWSTAMKGEDFSREDQLDTPRFNAALWRGLGAGPGPLTRDGRDLRSGRTELLREPSLAPCAAR
jgi:hypothetical protein